MKKNLLFVLVVCSIGATAQCDDLFISEYLHAVGNNRALEIYNPTDDAIDMSDYRITRWSNGNDILDENYTLRFNETSFMTPATVPTVSSKGVVTFAVDKTDPNGQGTEVPIDAYLQNAVDYLVCPTYDDKPTGNKTFYHNGNDAITLEKLVNGEWVIIDVFGEIGVDPGVSWTDDPSSGYTDANGGDYLTYRRTLIRKYGVRNGVTDDVSFLDANNPIASTSLSQSPKPFNAQLDWDFLPESAAFDTTYADSLGAHNCICRDFNSVPNVSQLAGIKVYPNPVQNSASIQIQSEVAINQIVITDALGKQIYSDDSDRGAGRTTIPTSELSQGMYLLIVEIEDGRQGVERILIQ